MLEVFGNYFSFIGDIFRFFAKAYFKEPAFFFSRVLEAPTSSFYELLFVLFLLGVVVALAWGVVAGIARRSLLPFIQAVETYVRLFGKIGAWVITILVISMVYEVIARYVFHAPTKWAFEVAYMLMGTVFMFGIAYCLQMRRHIRVDFLFDQVNDKTKAIIDLVGYMVLVPMLLWLTAGLWDYFFQAYRVDETSGESAWNPIIWPFKFTFVVAFVLLLLQVMMEVLKNILTLAGRKVPPPPPVEGLG
ncbi:MAG: TRAP transporter small permease subunit [Pseudomonadota bacterium]|uniref:Tripartite ATP-independent periplasmic transporters DctQ component domain-containing protein n=1 Tax=marine metagenome TaxID=408172 RepID=A0A381TKC3_9ZZZZ|nr:TRAP transporter small permease subunit [Pseudomonadota bacterium]